MDVNFCRQPTDPMVCFMRCYVRPGRFISTTAIPAISISVCAGRDFFDHFIGGLDFLGARGCQFYHRLRHAFSDQFVGMVFAHQPTIGPF